MVKKLTRLIGVPQPKLSAKKKKPISISKLKKKLWEECKRLVRKNQQRNDGLWNCYTCDKLIDEPFKAHTSHFIPSASCGAYLRYDLRNLKVCCYHCNINLGGNGSEFYRRLVRDYGQDYVDKIFQDKNKTIKADIWWYLEKTEEYSKL